jgi:cell fate (sporulation/competence/biofilm development) regulator YlbF (YheA/YmcA/DUF963 family)
MPLRRKIWEGKIMVNEAAKALAGELRASEEYTQYAAAREAAFLKDTTRALYNEYRRLQVCAQADAAAGRQDTGTLEQLRRVGELLQFDKEAADLLIAGYRLNSMLGRIYKLLRKP